MTEAGEGGRALPMRSPQLWAVQHPKAHLALYVAAAFISAAFLVSGVAAAVSGVELSSRFDAYLVLWAAATVVNALRLVVAVRIVKNPDAERARFEQRYARVMGQPREKVLRKAAMAIALITGVPLIAGVVIIATAHAADDRVIGGALVAVGAVLAALGAWRVRHPRI
jgi:hypothetical protein